MDTVKIGAKHSTLLTDGVKSAKDTLFFLADEDAPEKPKKAKKPPVVPLANGSPPKHKTVGGKVLRNQTRSAAQDETHMTTAARIAEHQKELHEKRQSEGLQKYSEEGGGVTGKEGKG